MNICPECFSNTLLQRRIKEVRPEFPDNEKCDFHPSRKGVPVAEVGKIVDPALRANYGIGEWMFDHQEGNELQFVVSDTTGADDDTVVQGIIDWLIDNDDYWPPDGEEAFYAEDQAYILLEPTAWRHSSLWSRFRDEIMHRQRFFNGDAQGLLRDIFDGVQSSPTSAASHPSTAWVPRTAGGSTARG